MTSLVPVTRSVRSCQSARRGNSASARRQPDTPQAHCAHLGGASPAALLFTSASWEAPAPILPKPWPQDSSCPVDLPFRRQTPFQIIQGRCRSVSRTASTPGLICKLFPAFPRHLPKSHWVTPVLLLRRCARPSRWYALLLDACSLFPPRFVLPRSFGGHISSTVFSYFASVDISFFHELPVPVYITCIRSVVWSLV